jgi:hypothetical protein
MIRAAYESKIRQYLFELFGSGDVTVGQRRHRKARARAAKSLRAWAGCTRVQTTAGGYAADVAASRGAHPSCVVQSPLVRRRSWD